MNIATLVFNPIQENTYVVWDDTKECVVIDAGNSNPKEDAALKNFIDERGLKPVAAVNTHGHFDHTMGVEFLRREYGVPFYLSSKDRFLLDTAQVSGSIFGVKVPAMPGIDGDLEQMKEFRFGDTLLVVIPTPGHTPARRTSSRATPSSGSRSDAPTCPAATIRGSCVRLSSVSCPSATRPRSGPDTARRPRWGTRAFTTPSWSRCSTTR